MLDSPECTQQKRIMFGSDKDEKLKLRILVETIGDSCIIRDVKPDEMIKDVKERIEAFIGIPR